MWDHARLLRSTLLVSSVLTLTGLHVPGARSPVIWRVARLIPLTLSLLIVAANLGATLTATNPIGVLESAMFGLGIGHSLFALACLQRRRAKLHDLLRRMAALEDATALCRWKCDHAKSQQGALIISVLTCLTGVVWTAAFFTGGEFTHPHYLTPVLVPEAMRTERWYWTLIGMQSMTAAVSFVTQAVFDLVQVGLMDAVALQLERLARHAQKYLPDSPGKTRSDRLGDGENGARPTSQRGGTPYRTSNISSRISTAASISGKEGSQATDGDHSRLTITIKMPPVSPGAENVSGSVRFPSHLTDPRGDLSSALTQISETHRRVLSLAEASSDLCSSMTLTQHASISIELLVGLYITIGMFLHGVSGVLAGSFVLFIMVTALRLVAVSVTGSRLATSGGHLYDALVSAAGTRRHLTPDLRFDLQMLVEQTRKPPQFTGGGFFVTQKTTMLSLLSFVLTYFIIMVQLNL